MFDKSRFDVADPSDLTDAEWAEINTLKETYQANGEAGWSAAMHDLTERNPVRALIVLGALYPELVREVIEDEMTESVSVDDARQIIQKLTSSRDLE